MRFPQRLEVIAGLTERRLKELIAERIETQAGERGTSPRLVQAVIHAALAGGKRVRPFLVMETARLFDVPDDASIDTAAALECIHCYSLVHDDLPAMDNDELRRGQPTVWKAYDEWTAILAGDALLTLAFEVLAEQSADPMKRLALISGSPARRALQVWSAVKPSISKPTSSAPQPCRRRPTSAISKA